MYTKPTKYKYRGHKFDNGSTLWFNSDEMNNATNSIFKNYQENINVVPFIGDNKVNNTSLPTNTGIDKPADNSGNNSNWFTQGMDAVNQVSPYFYITNTANQWGTNAAQRASKGKGLWTNLYNSTVNKAVENGATSEAAAKAGSEAVASKAGSIAGGAATAIQGITEAYQGWNQDLSGDPFSKEDAKMAVWNTASDNPLLYNPNVSAWSNLANNYKDYVDSLDKVGFNSNTQSMRSLGREWENQKMIDLNKSDLDKSIGRQILDYNVATGKGALIGLATGGPWGALAGAIVGSGLDLFNKYKANKNKDKILAAAKEADQRMYQQALNRRDIITEMNNRRDMINYSALGGKLFDQGGTMLNKFETGGSHEENPYGGILQGIAPDGEPNLVEQGETKWNEKDYVFSKRLTINKRLAKEYNLPDDFIGKTFAHATEKFNEKFKEHENDAISLATQKAIFSRTKDAQEALRADIKMKETVKLMQNLTPEEQQTLLTQLEQQPMETQQMQYPMGSETMQGGIPQGYAEGGHLFAGITPDLDDTSNSTDTKNTEDDWRKIRDAVKLVGSRTSNEPSPEYTYNAQFRIAVNNYWRDRVNKVKTKADAEQFEKDYNKYQDMYADIVKMSASGTDMESKEAKEKVASLQKAWRALGLDDYIPEGSMKGITQIITGNESKSDAQKKDVYDGMFGPQTFARAFKVDDDVINLGKQKGISWDIYGNNAWFDKARYNRGRQFLEKNPAYQEAIEKGVPAEELPEEYKLITVPEGYTPEQAKAYLKGQGYTFDKEDLENLLNDKYYFNKGETPQTQDSTDEIVADTTPELLPTWMRGVGALLPFAFLGQKSDYSNADMIQAPKIGFSPIADYLKYRPLDKQYYLNTANASQQNLRNNIVNLSGGNRAAAMNNLMIADLQAQNALGDLYRRAEEYNADQRAKVAAQNADVNKFNSNGFFGADQWNANAEFQARQAQAQMRHNIDVMTAQAKGANLTQGINNLIGIGNENARLNMIASNPALVAYYDRNFGVNYKGPKTEKEESTKKCGGYLTIKKRK